MKLTTITLAAVVALTTAATAETVAPANVQYDEYGAVGASLTGVAGDVANGRKVFMNRKKGNCLKAICTFSSGNSKNLLNFFKLLHQISYCFLFC